MKNTKSLGSSCRYCRHYELSGHRWGMCQQFEVHVKGEWSACPLYISAFQSTWIPTEDKMIWAENLSKNADFAEVISLVEVP